MSILTLDVVFLLVPIQKIRVLCDNCLVYSTSLVSNNYLGSNKSSVDNNFHLLVNVLFLLLFNLDYCLHETLSSLECYLYTSRHILLVPIQKSRALCDYCLVYSTSQVSNNYLGSNNCSVDNNFHLLVNVLFPIALQFRLLSV